MAKVPGGAMLDAALAMAIDRAGGEIRFTQSEYLAIKVRRGDYRVVGRVDRSKPGEPVISVRIEPAPSKAGELVS